MFDTIETNVAPIETAEIVVIPEVPEGWEKDRFYRQLQLAFDKLEADVTWSDEEGTTYRPCVDVRGPRHREARGTYQVWSGSLYLLVGTRYVPDELEDLKRRAFDLCCSDAGDAMWAADQER